MTRSLCIVGAGAAGVGAAYALRETDVAVTILEKSRGVCGRAATRRRDGCVYDHGANYVTAGAGRVTDLLQSLDPVEVEGPVWTVDAGGETSPGDGRHEHKWTWPEGITQLAKRLLARTDATVSRETRVTALGRTADGWRVRTGAGDRGRFDGVLLTPPAPQTAALLAATRWESDRLVRLRELVGGVDYRTVRTVVLHYDERIDRPWYALLDVSDTHPVGWLAREECKPGHVPEGESLLVAQMSPEWSRARHDEPLDAVAPDAAAEVAALLDDDRLRDPTWVDDQAWRYALPDDAPPGEALAAAADAGLLFAGDWVAGEGRVHAALENGLRVGKRVAERL